MNLYSFGPIMYESCNVFLDSQKIRGEKMKQSKLVLITVLMAPLKDIVYRMKIILFVLVKLVLGTNILRQVCCPILLFLMSFSKMFITSKHCTLVYRSN